MDTVCIPGFPHKRLAQEIVLHDTVDTDIFPVVNRDDAHFRCASRYRPTAGDSTGQARGDSPTGG